MSTRRQRSKNKDPQRTALHSDHIPGYRIGKTIGPRAFEIWQGFEYVCLLQVNSRGDKWAATHNMVLEECNTSFKHASPLEVIVAYQKRLAL